MSAKRSGQGFVEPVRYEIKKVPEYLHYDFKEELNGFIFCLWINKKDALIFPTANLLSIGLRKTLNTESW